MNEKKKMRKKKECRCHCQIRLLLRLINYELAVEKKKRRHYLHKPLYI